MAEVAEKPKKSIFEEQAVLIHDMAITLAEEAVLKWGMQVATTPAEKSLVKYIAMQVRHLHT